MKDMNQDMKENFADMFKDIQHASLTDNERATMRNNLQFYMHEHVARAPFSIRAREVLKRFFGIFDPATSNARLVPAFMVMVLVVGVGTSYAAENALPGDALYPIKIYFNENVQGSLAVSQASKAEWNTELMTRRLEEAESLTAQDRLTPVARTDIQTQLLRSADEFDKNVAALASTDDGAVAVATAQSNLEASLVAHVHVLAALTADVPAVQSAAADSIMATAANQANDSAVARTSVEAIMAKSDSPTVRTAALSKKADATHAVMTVRAAVAATDKQATTTAHTAAKTAFKAEQSISKGDENLNRGEYAKAFTIFQEAIRTAKSAEVTLDASARLKTEIPATTTEHIDVHAAADTSVATSTGAQE
ncbi:MAG: hypothetical protein JWM46_328 [Candidatus Kaiserbacteria bacterium]|nr:hypothetical protein [Candidatus Kaiserbacteria bacterium]